MDVEEKIKIGEFFDKKRELFEEMSKTMRVTPEQPAYFRGVAMGLEKARNYILKYSEDEDY